MNESWRLPREIEAQFRDALDHAAKRHISELHALLHSMTDRQQIDAAVHLCGLVAAYTAINTVSRRWPTSSGLHLMAEKIAQAKVDEPYGVTEQNVYLFLSRCALGSESFADVFGDAFEDADAFIAAPFFLTVDTLATFVPKGQTIWEFLDVIEDAYEKAWLADLSLLPALIVRARMQQEQQAPGSTAEGQ
jgi:hypothetical protein